MCVCVCVCMCVCVCVYEGRLVCLDVRAHRVRDGISRRANGTWLTMSARRSFISPFRPVKNSSIEIVPLPRGAVHGKAGAVQGKVGAVHVGGSEDGDDE